jgi:Domain of unknown function DUF11/Bacterial Ig domain
MNPAIRTAIRTALATTLTVSAVATSAGQASAEPVADDALVVFANSTTEETLVSLAPSRFADTRLDGTTIDGESQATGLIDAGETIEVVIGGRGSVPADATSAVMNLTAVTPTGNGYITAYDCDLDRPLTASLNFATGVNVGNEVVTALSDTGSLCLYASTATHLTVDVAGYVPATSSIEPIAPWRLLDTRPTGTTVDGVSQGDGRTTPGVSTVVRVAGRAGIPDAADAVIANVIAVRPTATGFVSAHPCLDPAPSTASLNYVADVNRGNELLLDLDGNGDVCIETSTEVDLVLDVVAYIPAGTNLKTTSPVRLADTRLSGETVDGEYEADGRLGAGDEYTIRIAGRGGVPADARSGVLNLAVVNPSGNGYVAMHPCQDPRPVAASANFSAGVTGANELLAELDENGEVCVFTSAAADLVVDASGFLAELPAGPGEADLSIAVTDSADPVAAGDSLSYTITVDNAGPDDATGVTVMETLPAGVTFDSTTGCGEDPNGVVSCTLGTIATGDSASFTVDVTVDASTSGVITNQAAVSSDLTDPDTSDNVVSETTTVDGLGTINIVKLSDPSGGTGYAFTDDIAAPNSFSLDDTETKTFTDVAIGTYVVTEVDPSPQTLTAIVCDDGTSTTPSTVDVGTRTATIEVDPGENVTCTFSNNRNLAPTITTAATANAAENQTAAVDVDTTDDFSSEGAGLTYSITGGADAAAFSIDAATGALTFDAAPDFESPADTGANGTYDVQVTVTDAGPGTPLTDVLDLAITVTDVSEAPSITTVATALAAENQTVVTDVQSTDPEGDTEGSGLTYSITGGVDQGDFSIVAATGVLTFDSAPDFDTPGDTNADNVYDVQITVTDSDSMTDVQDLAVTVTDVNEAPTITSGSAVSAAENQTAVTDVQSTDPEGDTEGSGLTYSITGGADQGDFSIVAATGVLTFDSAPDFDTPGDTNADNVYEVQITVTDSGSLTDVQNLAVTVTNINEAPVVTTTAGTTAFTEDGGAVVVDAGVTVTDPDSTVLDTATVTITNLQDGASEVLAATPSGGIVAGDISYAAGVLTIDPATGQSLADFQAVLRSVTYTNANNTPDTTARVVRFVVNDGAIDSADADKTVSVIAANDAPTLTAPGTYASIGNVGIDVPASAGLIQGATITDVDYSGAFTIGGTVPTTSAQGGRVVVNPNSGGFAYEPPAGFTGNDTFTYQVCDGGTPAPSACSTAATVTIAVSAPIWFIDDAAAAGGDGTRVAPFKTIGQFNAAGGPAANHGVFLADGTYADGIILADGQRVIGEGTTGTTLAGALGITTPTHSETLPSLDGTSPIISSTTADGIALAEDNTVRGLDVANTPAGHALAGTVVGTLTASEIDVSGTGGIIEVATSGNLDAVSLDTQVSTSTSSGASAIDLNGLTGTTGYSGGIVSISAASGSAIEITGATAPVAFAYATINGGQKGVELTNNSATFYMAGAIGGSGSTTQEAVDINGGSGNATFTTTISNGQGRAVDINGRTGGVITFTGSIDDTGGAGVALTNNSGSSQITFTEYVHLTNSTGTAVTATSNSGATISFADLDVTNTTSNQTGLLVSNSGTFSTTSGTINTGQATAVDLDNTNLGVVLDSVTSTGGSAVGIDIRNTTGTFTVNGDGASGPGITANNGSGGTIHTKTGDAIYLDTATGISLNYLDIGAAGALGNIDGNGVRANAVAGLTITRSDFLNVADQTSPDEAAVMVTAPTGAYTIANTSFDRSHDDHVRITNANGNLASLSVTDSRFTDNNDSGQGNDSLLYLGDNSSDATIVVAGNTFEDSDGDHVQVSLNGSASADVTIGGPLGTDGNTMQVNGGETVVGSGITLSAGNSYSGSLTYSIENNSIQGAVGRAINVNLESSTSDGSFDGDITNNVVGTPGTPGSGGYGVGVISNGAGTSTVDLTGNSVRSWTESGISLEARNGSNRLNATLENNTILEGADDILYFAGLFVASGALATDTTAVCLDVGMSGGNNTFDQMPDPTFSFGDAYIGTLGSSTIAISGYVGAPNDAAAIQSDIASDNVGNPSVDVSASGGNISGGGACAV